MVSKIKITFLGTSDAIPSARRNHTSIFLNYDAENILIDCGEGTQRQIRKAGLNPCKITQILITHWHGDHVLGLPGLVQNLSRNNYNKVLEIYGPLGSKEYIQRIMQAFIPRELVKYTVQEVVSGIFFENTEFFLEAIPLQHGIHCLGYRFAEKDRRRVDMKALKKIAVKEGPHLKELQLGHDIVYQGKKIKAKDYTTMIPGKKISIVTDTLYCDAAIRIAKDADLLFCESTFLGDLKEQAIERKHMTATQAATIAKKAKVKKLVLIHFSQRYKDLRPFSKEARKTFSSVIIGKDLDTFTL